MKLTDNQQATVEHARRLLAESQAEQDATKYPHHCGALEFATGALLAIIGDLAGQAGTVPANRALAGNTVPVPSPARFAAIFAAADAIAAGRGLLPPRRAALHVV